MNTKLLLDNAVTTFQFIHDHLIIFKFNSLFKKKKTFITFVVRFCYFNNFSITNIAVKLINLSWQYT